MQAGQRLVDDDHSPRLALGRRGRLGEAVRQCKALDLVRAQPRQEFLAEGPPLRARTAAGQLAASPARRCSQTAPRDTGGPAASSSKLTASVSTGFHQPTRLRRRAHERQRDDADGVDVARADAARQRVAVVPIDDLFGQAFHD